MTQTKMGKCFFHPPHNEDFCILTYASYVGWTNVPCAEATAQEVV